jgi:NAD(P)-dependent dehydrogenase (short-subunit alcohol dehydrogenase family)
MRGLDGKVAIVTGGGGGIGSATCRRFAAEGTRVVVADIAFDRAEAVAAEIGSSALAVEVDVSDESAVAAMVTRTVERFGRVDVLHNNAASSDPAIKNRDTDPLSVDLELWDTVLSTDLRGAFLGCRHVVPVMLEQGAGVIVNTSSTASLTGGMPFAYSAAKAGVNALTLQVAALYARRGIRCNAVCPGPTRTPPVLDQVPVEAMDMIAHQTLVGRWAEPSELAAAIVFLASDDASFITGEIIRVDGGMLAHAPNWADMTEAGQALTKPSGRS